MALLYLALFIPACATPPVARYVYQDGDYGVIAIPKNTYHDKIDYRAQADELMKRHFPEGHEIIRVEEVIEGQRTLDRARRSQFDAGANIFTMNESVKLGNIGRVSSYEEKDQIQLRESRIIYRRKPGSRPNSEFASVASLSPPLYVDPNQALRQLTASLAGRSSGSGAGGNAAQATILPGLQSAAAASGLIGAQGVGGLMALAGSQAVPAPPAANMPPVVAQAAR